MSGVRRLVAAAVLLLSCATIDGAGGVPACTTRCGLTSTEGDCESLQRYEARVLRRFAGVFDEGKTCSALRGWRVQLRRHDPLLDKGCTEYGWKLSPTFCASGLARPSDMTITITTTDWVESALAHEIAHVADWAVVGTMGHCRWRDERLTNALNDLANATEVNIAEKTCYAADAGTAGATQ